MSSRAELVAVATDLGGGFDRVLRTAGDRPEEDSLPPRPDPAADHCDQAIASRREDVDEKHCRVREYLDATNQDALVLGRADSVGWFTSGGNLRVALASELSSVLLYINRTSRAVITDNVHNARVFEEELAGLGFQVKERPWYEDPSRIIAELSRNKRVTSDLGHLISPWSREDDPIRALRRRLTALDRQRLRELGRTLTLAVEATCRNFDRGEREADVAGHLSHRLIREGVVPVELRVSGDDRLTRYRQPTFQDASIESMVTISVTGRRHGLCASVSRTVTFGEVDEVYCGSHTLAAMVGATCIYFSRDREQVSEVFRRARRIFEKFDAPDEWTLDYLGFIIGHSPRESLLFPDSPMVLANDMALYWSPSVGPARSGDTMVIDARGHEIVTSAQDWPQVEISVKGFILPMPSILER